MEEQSKNSEKLSEPRNYEQSKIKSAEDLLEKHIVQKGTTKFNYNIFDEDRLPKVVAAMTEYASQFKPLSVPILQDKIKEAIEWCNSKINCFEKNDFLSDATQDRLDLYKEFKHYLQSLSVPVLPENNEIDKFVAFENALLQCSTAIIHNQLSNHKIFNAPNDISREQYAELKIEWLKELGFYPISFGQAVLPISDEEVNFTTDNKKDQLFTLVNLWADHPHPDKWKLIEDFVFSQPINTISDAYMTYNEKDTDLIRSALNFYWQDANENLQRNDLGDLEKINYQYQLENSKRILFLEPESNPVSISDEDIDFKVATFAHDYCQEKRIHDPRDRILAIASVLAGAKFILKQPIVKTEK